MAKKVTNFLIALNDSIKLRDKWRDPEKRERLLRQWDLEDETALMGDAPFPDKMRDKVQAETGLKQVDLWIRSNGQTEENPEYDPNA
jgi:hypothetical protein